MQIVRNVAGLPCHRPLRVDPEVQQDQADRRDPGHHHDQQDPEALSHPKRGRRLVLMMYGKLQTVSAEEKYLQALPSLQQDLEDPEDQVYQTGQLDRLHLPDLFHQENPERV